MIRPTLYLMLGYPGAGKTTFAKILHAQTGAAILSSDDTRRKLFAIPTFTEHEHQQLYHLLDRELAELMKDNKDIIYDANLNRYRHRQEKYEIAKRYNYQVKLVWVQTPQELAKARRLSDSDQHDLVPPGENPGSMFERSVRVFEKPNQNEPYVIVDGTANMQKLSKNF